MDELYIRKVLDGDPEAFSYFIKTYKHMAFSIALSLVREEFMAEEAVQNAFINAFRNLEGFQRQSKFSTWFYRIVTNEALMLLRKQRGEPVAFSADYDHEVADHDTILSLEQTELRHLVQEGLKRLPPNESLALRLFYLEEQRIRTLCQITGWTNANAKIILHRARKRLFVILNQLLNQNQV
jgi:RNA polymerase sigma-70 factor (ECF subfamily)